jgi:hypothetical protein
MFSSPVCNRFLFPSDIRGMSMHRINHDRRLSPPKLRGALGTEDQLGRRR